ncbi:MAG: putative metal-binding motif-containing protein [Candidatus Nanoarchaeia archaeon]|nr:putative metal-binding motif-containing protein [Candidatus Nanoarchaeia archaeon]
MKKRILIVLFFIMLFCVTSVFARSLSGRVIDSETGIGISNVQIQIKCGSFYKGFAFSENMGYYADFDVGSCENKHIINAYVSNNFYLFNSSRKNIVADTYYDIYLNPNSTTGLLNIVVLNQNNQPLSGASSVISGIPLLTNLSGGVLMRLNSKNLQTISVSLTGYQSYLESNVQILSGQVISRVIHLFPCASTETSCNDKIDNNCNGLKDCLDNDCSNNPVCTGCIPTTEIPCDGIDQDCNGQDFLGTDLDKDEFKTEGGFCGEIDCNDNNANINPGATEICTDNLDNDCDGLVDCNDPDCYADASCTVTPQQCSNEICPSYNNILLNREQSCRSETRCDCYYSITNSNCNSCDGYTGGCSGFDNINDCQGLTTSEPNKCGFYCTWDDTTKICSNSNNCPDLDDDSICDSEDNCPPISEKPLGWYNPLREDINGNGIGDICDPEIISNCITLSEDGKYCLEGPDQETLNCSDLFGISCYSNQICSGLPTVTSDSDYCCIEGECGTVISTLTGTQYNVQSNECTSINEEGVGKKTVIKYNAEGQQQESYTIDCTVIPDQETVPFYTLFSVILTISVLIIFYTFRTKKFS